MKNSDELRAAAERVWRIDGSERDLERVYGPPPPHVTDDFEWYAVQVARDRKALADAWLAEHDETPLTLDILRAELGEPHLIGIPSIGTMLNKIDTRNAPQNLGVFRRILSVVQEQAKQGAEQ